MTDATYIGAAKAPSGLLAQIHQDKRAREARIAAAAQLAETLKNVALARDELKSIQSQIDTASRALSELQRRPKPVAPAASNVIRAPIPVSRPHVVCGVCPSVGDIIDEVSEFYGVSINEIKSPRRRTDIKNARHIAIFLCLELTQLSISKIGRMFDNRNHATIIHAGRNVHGMLIVSERIGDEIDLLKIKIAERLERRNGTGDANADADTTVPAKCERDVFQLEGQGAGPSQNS